MFLFYVFSEKKEFMLVAQKNRILRFDLSNPKLEVLPLPKLKNVVALEFDMRNNCVYWSDISKNTIQVSLIRFFTFFFLSRQSFRFILLPTLYLKLITLFKYFKFPILK